MSAGPAPILVTDDDDRVASLFELALQEAGFDTLRAHDGVEALEIIAQSPVSMVLLDSRMPLLGGAGVIAALRADAATERLPIIVVTAEGEVDAKVRGLEAGANDYLAKPVDIEELVARVRTLLRSQGAWSDAFRRQLANRTQVLEAIGSIARISSPEETAAAVVGHLLEIDGCWFAEIFEFVADGPIVPLALGTPIEGVELIGRPLPPGSEEIRSRAEVGPWIDEAGTGQARLFDGHGSDDVVAAPLRHGGRLIGLVALGLAPGLHDDRDTAINHMLSTAIDSAALISAVLGPTLRDSSEASVRADLSRVLAEGSFTSVFQPIVRLGDRTVVGYEALTRFDDGTRPDLRFAEAARLGLGIDLELATMERSLASSRALPAGAWLTLNASPELILEGRRVTELLDSPGRSIVLEVTEHARVDDYLVFRAAIDRLRPLADVAVDDAGAGFASLRHILELGPSLVKLDAVLTRDIDRDPVRQSLVAGFVHFGATAGFELLGEAVETEEEASALGALGVILGQGYLFGRPSPVTAAIASVR